MNLLEIRYITFDDDTAEMRLGDHVQPVTLDELKEFIQMSVALIARHERIKREKNSEKDIA